VTNRCAPVKNISLNYKVLNKMVNTSSLNLSELYYYIVFNVHVFEALITKAAVHI
jgi:hypothetical protein